MIIVSYVSNNFTTLYLRDYYYFNLYDNLRRGTHNTKLIKYMHDRNFIYFSSFDNFIYDFNQEEYDRIEFMAFYFEDTEYINKVIKTLKLPKSLKSLNCQRNCLEMLPELPEGLINLQCSNNKLTKLPQLPSTLKILCCDNNHIECLASLPDNLGIIIANNNKIQKISNFPKYLYRFECDNNELKYLPELNENLICFLVSCNKLIDFPNLPKRIYEKYKFVLPTICDDISCYDFKNNPIVDFIVNYFNRDINQYNIWKKKKDKKFVIKIEKWFIECKYNPKYKYCRNRLKNEYNEMYNLHMIN